MSPNTQEKDHLHEFLQPDDVNQEVGTDGLPPISKETPAQNLRSSADNFNIGLNQIDISKSELPSSPNQISNTQEPRISQPIQQNPLTEINKLSGNQLSGKAVGANEVAPVQSMQPMRSIEPQRIVEVPKPVSQEPILIPEISIPAEKSEIQVVPDHHHEQIPVAQPKEQLVTLEAQTPGVSAAKTTTVQAPQQQIPVQKTETRKNIEEVLSDGLTQLYQTMTPQEQEKFRTQGEVSATAIEQLIVTFKATAKKVVEIIRGWLSTIPRVNRFFLEQESKLKTDEIMKLQRQYDKDQQLKKIRTE